MKNLYVRNERTIDRQSLIAETRNITGRTDRRAQHHIVFNGDGITRGHRIIFVISILVSLLAPWSTIATSASSSPSSSSCSSSSSPVASLSRQEEAFHEVKWLPLGFRLGFKLFRGRSEGCKKMIGWFIDWLVDWLVDWLIIYIAMYIIPFQLPMEKWIEGSWVTGRVSRVLTFSIAQIQSFFISTVAEVVVVVYIPGPILLRLLLL